MSSELEFVEFVADQMEDAGKITFRKMFGEYGVYCDGKIIALICDNKLFIKPTEGGKKFIGRVTESPAYPGSKPYYFIEDKLEDRDWISGLVRITAIELPEPKPKTTAKPKAKKKK
jgi:TfoX/Sxy family transcriptional regulator of competence genes